MTHLLALALCLIGFAALAVATRRQQRDLIGTSLPRTMTTALRIAGAGALLFALGLLVAWQGWGLGLVMFSGHTSLAAGLVYALLVAFAGAQARRTHAG
jgi:uncharacterized membrane protein